eukprot:Tamp_07498.p1 GENE.Tamp_07498~~Tamp_07498.p1  ORF type:complete len:525 (+),score=63.01 Tamp_07498:267-1841(+)
MTAMDGQGGGFEREEAWVTPDPSRMPHCKVCKTQGCMHFRRGFAHLLALNQDCGIPTLATEKCAGDEGQPANADILVPTLCPCHGCNELVVRADLNRGHDKSLSFNLDQKTGEWKAEFVRYRYKRDTELVVGCAGRHKIIESPKAGRYAQLWCRTCCNCTISGKAIGNLVGCTNTAHWHTVTNRSYHEKTPFHQLANNLLQASYNEALQARIPFEDAIGLTGQTYYKMVGDKGGDLDQAPRRGDARGGEHGNGARGTMKRERPSDRHEVVRPDMVSNVSSGSFQGIGRGDPHLLRGMNGSGLIHGVMSAGSQGQIHQLQGLQPGGFWPRTGIDLAASGSNGHMSMIQMMQAERAVSERDAQRQRTGGSMKQTASIPHNAMMMSGGLGHAMSHGFNGMMTGKGGIPRGDPRMGSGHITFGVDAYNAFRGMFDHSGPIGINVGAGLSGSGLIGQGYSAPMRSAPLGLPSLGADFVSRFHQQTQQPGGGESVESRYREMEPPVAAPPKAQYDDLENVADILTFGGRV